MGEEEATMREKLIEAMRRALSRASESKEHGFHGGPGDWTPYAESALDAALGMLETPSEEMVTEGECWLREYDDRTDIRNDDAARFLKSMLATLRSPRYE